MLGPDLNDAFRRDLKLRNFTIEEETTGDHRIDGPAFSTRMLATDRLAGGGRLALRLMSRVCLRNHQSIMKELTAAGAEDLLYYTLQQIAQFQQAGEAFRMQHTQTEDVVQLRESILGCYTPEELLARVPNAVRLREIAARAESGDPSLAEAVDCLTAQQRACLIELLRKADKN